LEEAYASVEKAEICVSLKVAALLIPLGFWIRGELLMQTVHCLCLWLWQES